MNECVMLTLQLFVDEFKSLPRGLVLLLLDFMRCALFQQGKIGSTKNMDI